MIKTKICVIDDNEAVCDSLKFLFESFYGITVQVYHNPITFLETFTSDWDGCLIVDLFMPSLNGVELMKEIKKINNTLKIIIISGHGTLDAAAQSIKAGAYAFIPKPFKTKDLLDKINEILPA
jgi:two-component system response regulator FixJ